MGGSRCLFLPNFFPITSQAAIDPHTGHIKKRNEETIHGSVRIFRPPILMKAVAWPNQQAWQPLIKFGI